MNYAIQSIMNYKKIMIIFFGLVCLFTSVFANETQGYQSPPQHVLDVIEAPANPSPYMSPTRKHALLVSWTKFPPISQLAEPYMKLAGLRIEPRTRKRHDRRSGYGIAECAQKIAVIDTHTGQELPFSLPKKGCSYSFTWSPNGTQFAFQHATYDTVELWLGHVEKKTLKKIKKVNLNPMLGSTHQWMPDQKHILLKLVPHKQGPVPKNNVADIGPSIQESKGDKGESSTYELRDVLKNTYDEDRFEYYATSQLALLNIKSGKTKLLGKPGMYHSLDVSPDGKNILVYRINKPFSYATTYRNFAKNIEIWNLRGKAKVLASLPVKDSIPIDGVRTGPRDFEWLVNKAATLVWAEALDEGDWNVDVPKRDKVMILAAPFTTQAKELLRTEHRYSGFAWTEKDDLALLYEYDRNTQWYKAWIVNINDMSLKPDLLWDYSIYEKYKDPGSPVYRKLPNNHYAVIVEGDSIFLKGRGANPKGNRPFLDKLNLKTKTTERLFRSDEQAYESFYAFKDQTHQSFFTWHQSAMDPPNIMLRSLGQKKNKLKNGEAEFNSKRQQISRFSDPSPQVRKIKKRIVHYRRDDGVDLSFTLYTPPGYVEGTRVPTILYAYPRDYSQAETAGQFSGSEQYFTELYGYQLLLLSGYAIIDDASFPILGDPKKAYDTYIKQLVSNAKAAVNKAVEIGVADPKRMGVTGHSHGGLMAANLLAHTDLFQAGMANSGSYNKTFTPFGFQNESRTVWNNLDVYIQASPFFKADKINEPLLIMHGEDDANPGTTPLQSKKLYEAIRGNGGVARLVMYPYEPHWYSAIETRRHFAYEQLRWFDQYVKKKSN